MKEFHINGETVSKLDFLFLAGIFTTAFYMIFIPHEQYLYPLHVDEWVHMAYAETMLRVGNVTFSDPFSGQYMVGISSNLETGFQLFWGLFQHLSGISWIDIFRYGPGFIYVLTAFAAYMLGRREGFGLEAAFFACLVPTTVGILGPAFLVPVALGLPFVVFGLYVAYNFNTYWSYIVLFIFTCFLLSIHAATALAFVVVIAPYFFLNLKGNFKHSLGIGLAVAIPFLALFPAVLHLMIEGSSSLFSGGPIPEYIQIPLIIREYGYVPLAFGLLGVLYLSLKGGKRYYSLVLGLLALLLVLVIYFKLHYGTSIMYVRGLLYMLLIMGIVAGAGLLGVRTVVERIVSRLPKPEYSRVVGIGICIVLVAVTLITVIPNRQDTPYYQMIDSEDYAAFSWIRANVDSQYYKAVLDPWKATAFTAITQKNVYTRIHEFARENDEKVNDFLAKDCIDTEFLRENNISIVYTKNICNNPDLTEVRKYVYLLKTSE